MASLRLPLAVAVVLLFLTATVTARPCRSFFMSSSYTFRNPSSNTVTTITEFRSITIPLRVPDDFFFQSLRHPDTANLRIVPRALHPRAQSGFPSDYAFSSLRDRTKDILSVVLALLVGIGCGAVTASAMYLVWSAFSGRRDYCDDDFDSSDEDSDIETPKKAGYVKIPAAEAAAVEAPLA